ncbi:glycoside hydrolase family 99-like domain-containing protein [Vulcanococcus limneticus]|uniref:glycoside hydrolase family 99-like domain-containing protein n=1 Tax=Vulcanococcus limneticus TaxID=2170428 RepID=UPI00398C0F1E
MGHARGYRARYEVSKLVRAVLRDELSGSIYAILQEQLQQSEAAPIYFYPEHLSGPSLYRCIDPDPFYSFADAFRRLLLQQDTYGAMLGLQALLAGSTPELSGYDGSNSLLQCLEACLVSGYRATEERRERFGDHWRGNFNDLTRNEISAVGLCFDAGFYCGVYSDIRMAGINALDHFLGQGRLEGRQGTPIFDPHFYLDTNPDVQAAGVDPFAHYIIHGWREKRDPSEAFPHCWLLQVFPEAIKHPNGFCGYLAESISGEQKLEALHSNYNSSSNPDYRQQPASAAISGARDIARVFAFYLTQYHPIAQNDFAWGKGFTEWRNVTKAFPRFFGHYHPKLPADSTFYDLRLRENIVDQIELARKHGVSGFCFYYYWFSGERVLEQPLDIFLQEKDQADFPFCILWANENWTRKWDGLSKDVIIGQRYTESDQLQFIRDVEPLLLDPRYERVNGAPLLIVYRPDDLPGCQQWVTTWREYWRRQGHGDLHLVCVQFLPDTNPRDYGFDAMLQFPPNGFPNHGTHQKIARYTRSFSGNLFSYDEMQWRALVQQYDHAVYRTSVPSWDNESRRPQQGDIFVGSTPAKFRDWTTANLLHAHEDNPAGICFVNAWNEWAESACLEPDSRYGYAHLEALADARTIAAVQKEAQTWSACNSAAMVVHAFYLDSFDSISSRLELYSGDCDLYFTLPPLCCHEKVSRIRERFPQSRFFISENRGRDVLPFLSLIRFLRTRRIRYREFCKLHTKKSAHRRDGAIWLDEMVQCLLPVDGMQRVKTLLEGQVGMLIPEGHAVSLWEFMGGNERLLDMILDAHQAQNQKTSTSYFSSGTMFWIRSEVLEALSEDEQIYSFEYERGQVDGTLAHAWERAMALLVRAAGLHCRQTDGREVEVAARGTYRFANLEGRVDLGGANSMRTAGVLRTLQCHDNSPQQRIALLATYVRDQSDIGNVRQICSYLRKNGYFTVAINPGYNYTEKIGEDNICSYLDCDFYIERGNTGYDFGSWAEGFFLLKQRGILDVAITEELLIVNDSCYLVDPTSELIIQARAIDADVVGLTDSHQILHHLQSNFLLFRRYQECDSLLDKFFEEYLSRAIKSKSDVIQHGELALAQKFKQMHIQSKAVYEIQQLTTMMCQKYANSSEESWEALTLAKIAEGSHLNPHHYLSEILYSDLCCPLIKKQFLRENPGQHPNIQPYVNLLP